MTGIARAVAIDDVDLVLADEAVQPADREGVEIAAKGNLNAGQAERFDLFAGLRHREFPGGALLRTPSLVLGTLYHRLRDLL